MWRMARCVRQGWELGLSRVAWRNPLSWLGLSAPQAVVLAIATVALSVMVGARPVLVDGGLVQNDSYMRLVRLLASLEAGRSLDYIPRDNGGAVIELHWSHLLEWLILAIAQPLR